MERGVMVNMTSKDFFDGDKLNTNKTETVLIKWVDENEKTIKAWRLSNAWTTKFIFDDLSGKGDKFIIETSDTN